MMARVGWISPVCEASEHVHVMGMEGALDKVMCRLESELLSEFCSLGFHDETLGKLLREPEEVKLLGIFRNFVFSTFQHKPESAI